VPIDRRELSGLVVGIPYRKLREVKEELKEFRKKLNRKYGLEKDSDDVFYVGLYLFPVSQKGDSE
jgi:hypothetical protein